MAIEVDIRGQMAGRLKKKFLYGLLYLFFWLVIAGLIYLIFFAGGTCEDGKQNQKEEAIDCGGPCIPCAIKNAKPLKIFPVEFFENADQTVTVLAQIKNENEKVGIKNLPYTLNIYDLNNQKVFTGHGEILINPASNRLIIEAGLSSNFSSLSRGEVVYEEPKWEIFEKSQLLQLTPLTRSIEGNRIIFFGRAINNNPFLISQVEIQGILLSNFGFDVSASKTILRDIAPNNQTDFAIVFLIKPEVIPSVDFSKTKIVVETKK